MVNSIRIRRSDRAAEKEGDRNTTVLQNEGGFVEMNNTVLRGDIFDKEVIGFKELRKNLTDVMKVVLNEGKAVIGGNVRTNDENTVTIIATDLFKDVLTAYEFKPKVTFDKATDQYEAIIDEIGATGFGDTIDDLYEVTLDNVIDMTEEYFEKIDRYIKFEKYRKMYPYYLKIRLCKDKGELFEVLSLEKSSKRE